MEQSNCRLGNIIQTKIRTEENLHFLILSTPSLLLLHQSRWFFVWTFYLLSTRPSPFPIWPSEKSLQKFWPTFSPWVGATCSSSHPIWIDCNLPGQLAFCSCYACCASFIVNLIFFILGSEMSEKNIEIRIILLFFNYYSLLFSQTW